MLLLSYLIKIFLMVHSQLQTYNICGNKKEMKRNVYFSSVCVFKTLWIRYILGDRAYCLHVPHLNLYHALWDSRLSW